MIDSSRGWSGAMTVSSVTPRAGSNASSVASVFPGLAVVAQEARMRELVRQIDLQPIGRIVARDIGVDLRGRPVLHLGAEFGLAPSATRRSRSTSEKPPVSTGSVS